MRKSYRKPDAICAHGGTLRTLVLDIIGDDQPTQNPHVGIQAAPRKPGDHLVYGQEDFEKIATSCPSIVELGIPMPPVSLEYEYLATAGDFAVYNKLLAQHMQQLVTLNILDWPTNFMVHLGSQHPNPRAYHAFLIDNLAGFATDIFIVHCHVDLREQDTVKCDAWSCSLESVVFGVREGGGGCLPPQYFIRSKIVVLGKVRLQSASVCLPEMVNAGLDVGSLNYERRHWDLDSRRRFERYDRFGVTI